MLAGRIDAREREGGGREREREKMEKEKEGGLRGCRMKMYFWGCVGEWVGSVGVGWSVVEWGSTVITTLF